MILKGAIVEVDANEISHFVCQEVLETFLHNVHNMFEERLNEKDVLMVDEVEREADRLNQLFKLMPHNFIN